VVERVLHLGREAVGGLHALHQRPRHRLRVALLLQGAEDVERRPRAHVVDPLEEAPPVGARHLLVDPGQQIGERVHLRPQPLQEIAQGAVLELGALEVEEIVVEVPAVVGGDEAVKKQWRNSPACQARMRSLGLQTEGELQSWFVRQMDTFLTAHGRRLVGWDEILEGGLPMNAVVTSWRGEAGGIEAARTGHDVIMAPYSYTYFDYYQSEDRPSEPQAFPDYLPLSSVYHYEPIPRNLQPEYAKHILGAQGQLWTEYMPTPEQVEYMAFPRAVALAEVLWTTRDRPDFEEFLSRLKIHQSRLDILKVNYRPIDRPARPTPPLLVGES